MDVVTAEQAKIAEDAGAAAVMALERVPADIRADGGVARMSDPTKIEEIQEAVTIPVMAKARIGHFVEAQVLEALEVDYIDESEVLTPADEAHHIDKWQFKVPFVCGATNLGRGAAADRRGRRDDPLEGRGRHGQRRRGGAPHPADHRRDPAARVARRDGAADRGEGAAGAARAGARRGRARPAAGRAVLRRRDRHAGRRRADDAARRRGQLRRLRHLQVLRSRRAAPARSSRRPRTSRTPSAWPQPRASWARPCPGSRSARSRHRASGGLVQRRAAGERGRRSIGVLALQGDFEAHARALERARRAHAHVRVPGGPRRARRAGDPRRREHDDDARDRARGARRAAARVRPQRAPDARHLRGADHARPRAPRACST